MPKPNIYLLIGDNETLKLNKIEGLKKEILPAHLFEFNSEVLFAKGLMLAALEEALLRLPARLAAKPRAGSEGSNPAGISLGQKTAGRILVIRNIEKLADDCRQKILDYLNNPYPHLALVLEGDLSDKEAQDISRQAQTFVFRKVKSRNVFDLGRAIDSKSQELALNILSDLLMQGEKPEMLVGGLNWHWENAEKRLTQEKIKKGFEALLEADLNIKRSRLKPNIAMELLVVKLCLI